MSRMHDHIQKLCADRGLKIADLCRETGIGSGRLSSLNKSEDARPSVENAIKMADFLQISLDELLMREPPSIESTTICNIPAMEIVKRLESLPEETQRFLLNAIGLRG